MSRSNVRGPFRNQLLAKLAPAELAIIVPHLHATTLELRKQLETPNRAIENIFFVEHGIASVVATIDRDTEVEVGLIGYEGVSGLAVIHGNHSSPHSIYMQVGGDGQRMDVEELRNAMEASPALHRTLLRYAQAFMVQTAHTAIANVKASIEERLSRWILMAHDRVDNDEIPLTHEFLSLMVGTRRPGVTEAIHALVNRGLVRAERGVIYIIDREGLCERAGRYYGTPEAEYDRLIGV